MVGIGTGNDRTWTAMVGIGNGNGRGTWTAMVGIGNGRTWTAMVGLQHRQDLEHRPSAMEQHNNQPFANWLL